MSNVLSGKCVQSGSFCVCLTLGWVLSILQTPPHPELSLLPGISNTLYSAHSEQSGGGPLEMSHTAPCQGPVLALDSAFLFKQQELSLQLRAPFPGKTGATELHLS